jgi:hypothetical protein
MGAAHPKDAVFQKCGAASESGLQSPQGCRRCRALGRSLPWYNPLLLIRFQPAVRYPFEPSALQRRSTQERLYAR